MNQKLNLTRSTIEWLLIAGILTLFLWPFVQLWSIKAVPLFASDAHQRAAVAVQNILAKAAAGPFVESLPTSSFEPVPGNEDIGLEGMAEIMPHPDLTGLTIIRAHVRWGIFFFRKYLTLETSVSQTRP